MGVIEFKIIQKIKEIEVKDKGIIKYTKIHFTDGLNIITGDNATGKTTVIKEIFRQSKNTELSRGKNIITSLTSVHGDLDRCFLIDDELARLEPNVLENLFKRFLESKNQVITTLPSHIKIPKVKANIINTNDFELKR